MKITDDIKNLLMVNQDCKQFGCYFDTYCSIYLNIAAKQVQYFKTAKFSNDNGVHEQDNTYCQKLFRNVFNI